MASFSLMRRILPRRSFVFSAQRRESPIGGRNQPPSCGRERRRSGAAREAGAVHRHLRWFFCACARRKNTLTPRRCCTGLPAAGLDLVRLDVRQRLEGRVDLRGGRVERERRRGLTLEGQRERAAGHARDADDLLLVGLLVVERAVATAVDAAGLVSSPVPAIGCRSCRSRCRRRRGSTPPVQRDAHDLLLGVEVHARLPWASSTSLKRESWK